MYSSRRNGKLALSNCAWNEKRLQSQRRAYWLSSRGAARRVMYRVSKPVLLQGGEVFVFDLETFHKTLSQNFFTALLYWTSSASAVYTYPQGFIALQIFFVEMPFCDVLVFCRLLNWWTSPFVVLCYAHRYKEQGRILLLYEGDVDSLSTGCSAYSSKY
jgi:amino acid transporter